MFQTLNTIRSVMMAMLRSEFNCLNSPSDEEHLLNLLVWWKQHRLFLSSGWKEEAVKGFCPELNSALSTWH